MRYPALAALGLSIVLNSTQARAQDDTEEDARDSASGESEASADLGADELGASADEEEPAATGVSAEPELEQATDAESATDAPPVADEPSGATRRAAVYGKRSEWSFDLYGYARFDAIRDSTQSFDDSLQPWLIQRAGTYRGNHGRATLTARDSRLGIQVGAPEWEGIESSAQLELDFYGLSISDAKKHDQVVFGPLRIRHAFFKLQTSILDVIAGQTYDLFGWGGSFYPATVAYLGVPGEIYHRNPQLRLSKTLELGAVELEIAAAIVRPGQRDNGGVPDGQAGIKLAVDDWSGIATSGFGRPEVKPLSFGVSGLFRHFEVPVFETNPGAETATRNGYGIAAQLLLPVIPAESLQDKANSLTATGEFSVGTGVADLYGLDGGSRFPVLPNPAMNNPPPPYPQNIDPGLVTFDRAWVLQTLDWTGVVLGLQYYLPVGNGQIWVSGIYSRVWSDNIKELTPPASYGGVFTKMEYIDASLGIDITPAIALGLSFQTLQQTFADVSSPTPIFGEVTPVDSTDGAAVVPGTGGDAAQARNNRVQLSMAMFF